MPIGRTRAGARLIVHELQLRRGRRGTSGESLEMIGCGAIGEIGGAAGEAHAKSVCGEQEARENRGIANGPAMSASERAGLDDDGDGFAAALNLRDAAEKLAGIDRRIFFGERVAARGEDDAIALWPFAHDAVNERAAAEKKKNNFAAARFGCGIGTDGKEIAGIDRRDHAAAVCDEADFAETMEDFGGEVEAGVVR
jgi:hypothetical protein